MLARRHIEGKSWVEVLSGAIAGRLGFTHPPRKTCRKECRSHHTKGYQDRRRLLCYYRVHCEMVSQHSHSRLPAWGRHCQPHTGFALVVASRRLVQEERSLLLAVVGIHSQDASGRRPLLGRVELDTQHLACKAHRVAADRMVGWQHMDRHLGDNLVEEVVSKAVAHMVLGHSLHVQLLRGLVCVSLAWRSSDDFKS